ncbi:MAG: hypothetical protein LBE98_00465 [Puniceicoccales bacterium]|nr:hypothetical protein [Puniceicoccales bacterium]
MGSRGSREKSKQPKRTREALASILFMGSMVCVMVCVMLCGGCRTMGIGSGGRLPVPGTLSSQSTELKDINGRLYDYLQILLWVGRNNYDNHDNYDCGGDQGEGSGLGSCKPGKCEPETENCNSGSCKPGNYKLAKGKPENHDSENYKAEMRSYRLGNGLLGNRRLRNYESDPDPGSRESGKGKSRNKEIGMRALDGCMEIVGLPDGNERILANNMDREGVDRMVREAKELKARKEKLVGKIGKDVALLEKRYVRYESSHRTLRALQVFGGLVCAIIVVFGVIFFRLR